MGKVLLFTILGVFVYWYFTRAARPRREERPPLAEDMVQCAHCLTHIPQRESLLDGDRHYCCEEHRRLGRK